jgi:hypothetical protein
MRMHTCTKCGETKPITLFNKKIADGPLEPWNVRRCKDCAHADYMKRYQQPERRAALQNASKNWRDKNPERHAELARGYRQRHPEKVIAHNRLNYAVRKGLVLRKPCEICGTTEKVHAHHVSYLPEDWYNVRWLCHVCHKLEHMTPDAALASGGP